MIKGCDAEGGWILANLKLLLDYEFDFDFVNSTFNSLVCIQFNRYFANPIYLRGKDRIVLM